MLETDIAKILLSLLWANNTLASQAALHLGVLLSEQKIKDELSENILTKEQKKSDQPEYDVWGPFKQKNSSLPIIVGRIAYLIEKIPKKEIVNFKEFPKIELGIIIPLSIKNQNSWKNILESIPKKTQQPKEKKLLKLNSILKDETTRSPTLEDWKNIFLPSKYEFKKSWHFSIIISILISMTLSVGFGELVVEKMQFIILDSYLLSLSKEGNISAAIVVFPLCLLVFFVLKLKLTDAVLTISFLVGMCLIAIILYLWEYIILLAVITDTPHKHFKKNNLLTN